MSIKCEGEKFINRYYISKIVDGKIIVLDIGNIKSILFFDVNFYL